MHSRDLEVAALSIQTRRLVEEANALVKNLRAHEKDLAEFIGYAHEDLDAYEARLSREKPK